MKIKTSYTLLALLIPFLIFAESYSNKFLYTQFAVGYGNIKDTGTSPLRYDGSAADLFTGYIHNSSKNNFELLGCFSTTIAFAEGYILNHYMGGLDITYLHKLPIPIKHTTNIRIGLNLSNSFNINYNSSYQNASFNMDMLIRLSLRSQIQHSFEIQERSLRFLGINFNIKHQRYTPFFRFDLPLLILNGRPEFAYVNENQLGIFDRHYFFGGYHLKTQLGIKKHLNNGNQIELSYVWLMHTSGKKDIYLYEEGSHKLAFSLYFKTN